MKKFIDACRFAWNVDIDDGDMIYVQIGGVFGFFCGIALSLFAGLLYWLLV